MDLSMVFVIKHKTKKFKRTKLFKGSNSLHIKILYEKFQTHYKVVYRDGIERITIYTLFKC